MELRRGSRWCPTSPLRLPRRTQQGQACVTARLSHVRPPFSFRYSRRKQGLVQRPLDSPLQRLQRQMPPA
jgi:hypothetical protein